MFIIIVPYLHVVAMEKVSQQQIILGKGFFLIKLVQFWKNS
jgi:hypothetical protein